MPPNPPDNLPDYPALYAALQRCGLAREPAELHGFALGMALGGVASAQDIWCAELYAEFDPADLLAAECRRLLDQLFTTVLRHPDSTQPLQLTLLLPQHISVDSARLGALRDWCQGFLFGFGLGGEPAYSRLSAEARGFFADIAEFTRLDTDSVEDDSSGRAALIAIEEYLREGVMLMADELQSTEMR